MRGESAGNMYGHAWLPAATCRLVGTGALTCLRRRRAAAAAHANGCDEHEFLDALARRSLHERNITLHMFSEGTRRNTRYRDAYAWIRSALGYGLSVPTKDQERETRGSSLTGCLT